MAEPRSVYQQIYTRFILASLTDLTVLGLLNEYWDLVIIESFSVGLLAAILLQTLLLMTIAVEHRVSEKFKSRDDLKSKILKILSVWGILIISKVIILETINFVFGDAVQFLGPIEGIVVFITVVIAILVAEQLMLRIYRAVPYTLPITGNINVSWFRVLQSRYCSSTIVGERV